MPSGVEVRTNFEATTTSSGRFSGFMKFICHWVWTSAWWLSSGVLAMEISFEDWQPSSAKSCLRFGRARAKALAGTALTS